MKTILEKIFILIFAISPYMAMPQNTGETAPDFTLNQLEGGNFTLSDHHGKVIFIFWLGYNCPFCKSASPSIKQEITDYFKNNPNFIAIGIDTWDGNVSSVNQFKSQTGLDINYLLTGSKVASTYKTTYDRLSVIDKNGILIHKGTNSAVNDINSAKASVQNALDVISSVSPVNENTTRLENYPNPFESETTIRFQLDKTSLVTIDIYSVTGMKVRELTRQSYASGEYELHFSKYDLASGAYLLRLRNENQTLTRKMIIR
jgi:peroxiredoxin